MVFKMYFNVDNIYIKVMSQDYRTKFGRKANKLNPVEII